MSKVKAKEEKYKLFRTVKEILHPTISKRNISNYRIVLADELLPVQVFYPKKVSNIDRVIIFIPGNEEITECQEKYSIIEKELSLNMNSLLISIDYEVENNQYDKLIKKVEQTINHIYNHLLESNIDYSKIILMGDSTGGHIISCLNDVKPKKRVLFYPVLSLEYFGKTKYNSIIQNKDLNYHLIPKLKKYFNNCIGKKDLDNKKYKPLERDEIIPRTVLFVGSVDCLKDEVHDYYKKYENNCSYIELPFLSHGFLKKMEKDEKRVIMDTIEKMIEEG